MAGEDEVLAIVLRALENLNEELEADQQVPVAATTLSLIHISEPTRPY